MQYRLDYTSAARKEIERLDRSMQQRILSRIATLADDPRPRGSVKLAGEDAYRIRIGDYRVIYSIHDNRLLVLVIDVGHRREVYRRR